jgi:uroporphyrinogen decarboxylase-like protein
MISGVGNFSKAIEFESPEYLPSTLWVSQDWLYDKDESKHERIRELQSQFRDDMLRGLNVARGTEKELRDGVARWKDEWGTGWEDDGHGGKTETYPLMGGYDSLDEYTFPDPYLQGRFAVADNMLLKRPGRYVRASVWFTLFERLWMLRGFENMLMDPYVNEHDFCLLRDKVVDYNLAIIDQWLERGVNAIFFSDDWGSQRGLLMNPDDWRKFYKPSYKRMFDRVRSGGAHVWMHLCGNIAAILPDLLDIGLNVLNPVQPQAMDVKKLSREFGGKLCFNGGVDVQGTLIHGSTEDVKQDVHQLVDLFGRSSGGYIGGTSHSVMPETPLDNVIAMYETFLEYQNRAQPNASGSSATESGNR